MSTRNLLGLFTLAVAMGSLATSGPVLSQTPLDPYVGSPFVFATTPWASGSSIVATSWFKIFIANSNSDTITVALDADGTCTYKGTYPTSPYHNWMRTSALANKGDGTRLYVVSQYEWGGPTYVSTHEVAPDGTLTFLDEDEVPGGASPGNIITYVRQTNGDTVYVNRGTYPNSVAVFQVAADGTLTFAADVPTGGNSSGSLAGARTLATAALPVGRCLYAANRSSNTISAFQIADDGTGALTSIGAASVPSSATLLGAVTAAPSGAYLYAAVDNYGYRRIARWAIQSDGSLVFDAIYPVGPVSDLEALVASPNGVYLAATDPNRGVVNLIDTASMRPVMGSPVALGPNLQPAGLALNHNGSRLYLGFHGSDVKVGAFSVVAQPPLPQLVVKLTPDPVGQLDRFGSVTITCKVEATLPGQYWVQADLRQKSGQLITTASAGGSVLIDSYDGSATLTLKLQNGARAFKGGAAELKILCPASDPVSGQDATVNLTEAIRLRGGK